MLNATLDIDKLNAKTYNILRCEILTSLFSNCPNLCSRKWTKFFPQRISMAIVDGVSCTFQSLSLNDTESIFLRFYFLVCCSSVTVHYISVGTVMTGTVMTKMLYILR